MGVTYRGKHSDEFGLAVKTNPHMLPDFENNTESIPGMDGEYYRSTEYGMRIIPLEIGFVSDGLNDYEKRLKALSSWLRPDHGVGAFVSDNDPDTTYYAVLSSQDISRVDDIARMGEGSFELICPDPFGYGREKTQDISGATTVANEGTAETYPKFELNVNEDTTFISAGNESNLKEDGSSRGVFLGTEQNIDEDAKPSKKLLLHDTMQSTSSWADASEVDSGYVSGSIKVDGDNGFMVDEWGDENDEDDEIKDDWIGPSLKRSLDTPVHNFRSDLYIETKSDDEPRGVGIIEIYLRDLNGNTICKAQFGDRKMNAIQNHHSFEYEERLDRLLPNKWNDFNGLMRIDRATGYFRAYIIMLDENGNQTDEYEFGRMIAGNDSAARNDVKEIQIAMRKWYGSQRTTLRIKEMKFYETVGNHGIVGSPDDTPKIEFEKGDKLEVDNAKNFVRLNGEFRPDLLHLDSEFFSLVEGLNELKLNDNVEGTVTFRNRCL